MTLKTSCNRDNRGFWAAFSWHLRHCLPLGIFYGAVSLVFSCLVGLQAVYNQTGRYLLCFTVTAMALLLPIWQLNGRFSRRRADLLGPLPATRGQIFGAGFLSGLLYLEAPLLLGVGVSGITVLIEHPDLSGFGAFFFLSLCLAAACLYSLCCLAAECSGTYWIYGLSCLLLAVAPPALLISIRELAACTLPGNLSVSLSSPLELLVSALSPGGALLVFLPNFPYPSHYFVNLFFWAGLTVLTAWAGLAAARRRPGEAAGSLWMLPALQLGLRIAFSVAASLAAGCILCFSLPILPQWPRVALTLSGMALALALCWFLMEAVCGRGFRNAVRNLKYLGFSLGIVVLLVGGLSTGLGLDNRIPELADVESVQFPYGSDFAVSVPGSGDRGNPVVPGVSSPEQIKSVIELQKEWILLERKNQFPYLPGRMSLAFPPEVPSGGYGVSWLEMTYMLKDEKPFTVSLGGRAEPSEALEEEQRRLLEKLNAVLCSEEYVSGIFPLCAVDAADALGKSTAVPDEFSGGPDYDYFRMSAPESPTEISSLKDPDKFREQLEAALLEDFQNNRLGFEQYFDGLLLSSPETWYAIRYEDGARFTSRGGVLSEQEPIQGKQMILSLDSDSGGWCFITPDMSKTYALLEKTLES